MIDLQRKIILGTDEKTKKYIKPLIFLILFLSLIVFIMVNLFFDRGLVLKIIFNISFVIYLFLILFTILSLSYQKIEIENSIITKINLFNKKKVIGNISQITSFCESSTDVFVLKNNDRFFSFQIFGRSDNSEFYDFLKNNYHDSIFIKGTKMVEIILYMFSVLIFVLLLLENYKNYNFVFIPIVFILLFIGLDEKVKKLQIVGDEIIYRRLFIERKIKLCDLVKIEYRKNRGFGRYIPIFTSYTITGFNDVSKCFKVNNITENNLKTIKDISKKYNIKVNN